MHVKMGYKMVMRTLVIIVILGVAAHALISEVPQKSPQIVVFGLTAERQKSGIWDFLIKTAANATWKEKPRFGVDVKIVETGHPIDVMKGSWIEMVSGVHVSSNGTVVSTQTQPSSTSLPLVKKWSAPADYTQIAGLGYYKVHREGVKWETARRRCSKEGAHLLILNSPAEAEAVVAASEFPEWSWLGFDDFSLEGEFITLHGTTLEEAGYTQWAPDEPTEDLRCGVASVDGLLGTGNCDLKRGFVCEFHSPDEHVRESRDPELPVGYRPVGNLGFYRVHRDRAKWETARRRCEAEGAHLAVANTALEAAAVFRTSGLPGWFWVGFDDHDHKGIYVNFDGQQLRNPGVYSKFAADEPDPAIHCGVARGDAKLGTGTCKLEREYICERYEAGEKPPTKSPSLTAPPGYVAIGDYSDSLYKVHRDEASWETARRRCEDEGAHLMFVNSQDEAHRVLKGSSLPGWFWLGFDDFSHEGEYAYLNGTRLEDSGYVKWAKNEPTEDLDCGVARTDGLLGTGNCKLERGYICEWDKPRSPPPPPSPYPPGYKNIRDLGVYKAHRDRVAWETARRICEAEGARLMIVKSQTEADAVLKTSGLPSWFWLGFDDFDSPSQYIALDGTTLRGAGYEKWDSREPSKGLNCGVATHRGLLGTGNCKIRREYICELI